MDDDFWNALTRNAGDLGEETTNTLAEEFFEEAASIEGTPAPGTWSDYILEEDPGRVLRAFKVEPQAIKLDQPLTAYRYWSGDPAREVGNWLTLNPSLTPEEARALLALPNNNLAVNVTEFIIPNDTVVLIGEAASQTAEEWAGSYAIGGGFQIYVPDPLILMTPQGETHNFMGNTVAVAEVLEELRRIREEIQSDKDSLAIELGFPRYLKKIEQYLSSGNLDRDKLERYDFGIFRLVTESYTFKQSALGKELLSLGTKIKNMARELS